MLLQMLWVEILCFGFHREGCGRKKLKGIGGLTGIRDAVESLMSHHC